MAGNAVFKVGEMVRHKTDKGPLMSIIGYAMHFGDNVNTMREYAEGYVYVAQWYDEQEQKFVDARFPAEALVAQ